LHSRLKLSKYLNYSFSLNRSITRKQLKPSKTC